MTLTQARLSPVNSYSTSSTDPRLDLDLVPGPEPMPVVGYYGNIARFFLDTLNCINALADGGYGRVVSFARGMQRGILWPKDRTCGAVFVFGRDMTEQVLIKRAEASFQETVVVAFPKEWKRAARLNGGLLWLSGPPHRKRRKLVVPLYHQRRIGIWRDLMVSVFGAAIDRFDVGAPVDTMQATGDMLIDFQNHAVLGVNGMTGEASQAGQRIVELLGYMSNPATHFTPDYPYTPRRRMKEHADRLSDLLCSLIATKRARADDDVLSSLIHGSCEDGSVLTDAELIAETFGLFIGGWASTRASMAWTLLMLAQHPQVAANLYDELTAKLHGDAPTVEQLKELPLLDAVVKESHRLFPPIPLVTRIASEEVELGGYSLPRGIELFISIYHTHREPEVYAQPLRFRPERWETLHPGPYEYLPFGIGPRVCPGNALAVMQMKILLAMMVQRYRFEPLWDAKIDCVGVGVVVPKPDVRMFVRKQDRRFVRSRTKLRGNVNDIVQLAG